MITTILFDLDETLYDQHFFYIQVHKAVADYIAANFGKNPQRIYEKALKILRNKGSEYGHIYNDILVEEQIFSQKTLNRVVNFYRKFKPEIELYEDFKIILPRLKQKYKLGIITDGVPMVQKNKYRSLKIKKYIPFILFTRELGRKNEKPSTLPYKIALKKLKSKPLETVFIGDNPKKDFSGAKKLKIKTIRILRGEHKKIKAINPEMIDFSIRKFDKNFINLLKNT